MADDSHPIENIVLNGRKGNGKSATGNSIAGRYIFHSESNSVGGTMECQTYRVLTEDGPILNVIDTPGLFNSSESAEFISKEIVRCLTLAEGGIHAVLLVLSARKLVDPVEERVLDTLQILFGSKILDYVIVVFSGGDLLEEDDLTLEEYLGENCPKFIKSSHIVWRSKDAVRQHNNITKDEVKKAKQVHEFITLVDQIGKQNNRKPYTGGMYHRIKEETDKRKEEHKDLESKGHSEEQLKAMRKELQLSYDKAVSDMMQNTMKAAAGGSKEKDAREQQCPIQ